MTLIEVENVQTNVTEYVNIEKIIYIRKEDSRTSRIILEDGYFIKVEGTPREVKGIIEIQDRDSRNGPVDF